MSKKPYFFGGGGNCDISYQIKGKVYKAIYAWTYINPIDMLYIYNVFMLFYFPNCAKGLCSVSLKEKNI